jgi:hypothetical protein
VTHLIPALLASSAACPGEHASALAAATASATAVQLDWVFEAGLGPLLQASLGAAASSLSAQINERLLAADLTARVLIEQRVDAALDVVDACRRRGDRVTLLKGISLSHYQYASAHFRPMTDVDLLVDEASVPELEQALMEQGYCHAAPVMEPGSHHGEPLYHPRSGTRVELHSRLFPITSPLHVGTGFGRATLERESIDATFHGRPVRRLSSEFQLVYLAAAWNRDLCSQSIHPSFVFGLFDAVALTKQPFDWDRMLDLLDNPVAAASLDVLLACLVSLQVVSVPARVLGSVRQRHRLLGASEIAILTALVNGYLLRGRRFDACNSWRIWSTLFSTHDRPGIKTLKLPWYVAFPLEDPHRFDVSAQWRRFRRWALKGAASHR